MREVQLFIKPFESSEYTRVDLFDDETISITQTIKNANDVSKIFTDFTKSFTIPASKNNNAIFRHYYNYSIDNGFDGRKRVDARIEINSIPFKSGKIKLDGVDLKDDSPYAYRLTFYGNTIKIKDALGEEELSSLTALGAYDTTYSAADLKTGLQSDPALNDLIVPLITHSQRLTYGSGLGANSGDLKPDANSDHGLFWSELKYAIRVDAIVQAILDKIGVTLSDDSFFNSSNSNYYNLFMWLHRKSGDIQNDILTTPEYNLIDGFSGNTSQSSFTWVNQDGSILFLNDVRYLTGFTLRIDNPSSISYNVTIYRDGEKRLERTNVTDTTIFLNALGEAKLGSQYQVYASSASSNDLTFTWVTTYQEPFNPQDTNNFVVTTGVGVGADSEFFITQQLPEMKIVDFLSGLFKMFNLVAELSEDNVLTVKTVDQFYQGGVFRDISQYVDNTSGSVDVAIQYSEIEYKYVSSETILANQYNQLRNKEWGADYYNSEDNLKEGETFTFEIPFEHMQFERLNDLSTSAATPIMYGYYVDDNQDPYIGAPLLFYPVLNALGASTISYVTEKDGDGNFNTVETITGSINVPSNSITLDGANDVLDNLHFFLEDNEYNVGTEFYKTLFYNYHYNYIASLFNFRNRLTKVNAILPVPILVNYSLADTLTIQGNRYRINSISTNLNTGESQLELLNVIPAYTIDGAGSAGGSTGGDLEATISATISGETEPAEGTSHIYSSTVVGTATGITSYSWSVSNGGTIVGSNTNANVEVSWDEVTQDTIRSLNLTVSRNNDGDPKSFTTAPYYVTVQDSATPPPPTPLSIDILMSGGTPDDAVAEGALRIYDAALYGDYEAPVTYTWAADGGTITSGQGTDRVNVTWDEIAGDTGNDYNGSITLTVSSNDGQTPAPKSYPVRVVDGTTAPYIQPTITNVSSPVDLNYTTSYGVSIDSNITTSNPDLYSWSITGGTINSGALSDTVNVTWDTAGTGTISVTVTREGESGSDSAVIAVEAYETTATITGDFTAAPEGTLRTYGSSIGGNTTGTITYTWVVSKGEISGGSYDGNGNSVISGTNIPSIDVTWGNIDIGTGSISLSAVRQGYEGNDFESVEVVGIYYLFTACDGGETVVSRQVSDPPFCDVNGCRRYANYSVNPIEYYVYADSQVNSPAGFTEIGLQPVTDGGSPTYGCPTPEPEPVEDITVTGQFSIPPEGQNGVVYDINTVFNTTGWQVDDQALGAFNPIDLTFITSTSGTGTGSVTVNFGPYNGDGTETLRSQIIATSDNVTPQVTGTIELTQGPPPPTTYYIMTPCDPENWGTVMIESATAPSANQRAEGSFSNYYTYSGNTTTDPNAYSIASLTLLAATGCPPAPSCTRYQALNEGSGTVYFLYTDCTSGGSRLLNVAPNEARSVCAKNGEFEYASGDTNYTITELGSC